MKKLSVDARMLKASGIGTYLQNLLPFLDAHYQLFLLGNEKEISELHLKNAEVIPTQSGIYSLKEQVELSKKIPDSELFWSPHYNTPLLPIKSKRRIVTIHDVFHLKFYDTLSFSQKIYATVFLKGAARVADEIITVSSFSKKELLKYVKVSDKKISVIYNGVNDFFYETPSELSVQAMKKNYSLPDRYVLFVGNLKPHKNILNLLHAFSLLKKDPQFIEYKLVVVGKKNGFITGVKDLELTIQNAGIKESVIFLEHIKSLELPILYKNAGLLVFPTFYEGFGLPPLEAMACQCPTLVSDIECLREIYENTSHYMNPAEPESICRGIKEILTNNGLRNKLLSDGFEHSKKFSWKESAMKHLHIFEKTLQNR